VASGAGSKRAVSGWKFALVNYDLAIPDKAVQVPQMLATTWTQDAQPAVRFEQSAMRSTAQQPAITVHELVVVPIEWNAQMWAAIQICMDSALPGPDDHYMRLAHEEAAGLSRE
jgi:hypothetical protein